VLLYLNILGQIKSTPQDLASALGYSGGCKAAYSCSQQFGTLVL